MPAIYKKDENNLMQMIMKDWKFEKDKAAADNSSAKAAQSVDANVDSRWTAGFPSLSLTSL